MFYIFYFHIFFLLYFSNIMVLSDALIFTHIAASNTASDDVTNYTLHIEYLIQTYRSPVLVL